jgi:O-antigen/teichoic acid export membrane protein
VGDFNRDSKPDVITVNNNNGLGGNNQITALLNTTVPKIMAALKAGGASPVRIALSFAMKFCGLSAVFGMIFLLIYTLVAHRLLPPRYSAAVSVVYVLVALMQLRGFYVVVGTVTDYLGMTAQKLAGCVLGAAISVGSSVWLVPQLGLFGAAVGVGLGYAALGGWLLFRLARRREIPQTA